MSLDRTGERLGVTRQRRDCDRKAKERGWVVAQVFEDNDVSASTGKRRPAYEQMLDAIRSGRITAVVVWDLDRLTRRPIEIEQFIELADSHGVALASVGGDVDLATDNGRMFARIKGAVARAEVERKTARQKAANQQRRDSGRPHIGRRCFGYGSDGMAVVADEAALVQQAVAKLIAGDSVHGITRWLNDVGSTTTTGNDWTPTVVRRMLSNPRYAALLEFGGQIVGAGVWPAVIDVDSHHAAVGVLADPERHKAGPPRRYLLSGIAQCVCGLTLFGGWEWRRGYTMYRCKSRAHYNRRGDLIDDHVESVIVARLERPDAIDLFSPPAKADRVAALQAEERALRSRLDGLAEAFAEEAIDAEQLRAGSSRLRKKLAKVTAELAGISRIPDLGEVLTADDISLSWLDLPIDRRRAIIKATMTITVVSPGQGARSFRPAQEVKIRWKKPA
jgi:DNA invertase Pin-like site-specific DNA recombinase